MPMIWLQPPTDMAAALHAVDSFAGYDYIVFTSANAAVTCCSSVTSTS